MYDKQAFDIVIRRFGSKRGWHTLCANLCCWRPTAIAPPCRALDNGLEYEEADGRIEARVLEFRALCIAVTESKYLQIIIGTSGVQRKWLEKQHDPEGKIAEYRKFEMLTQSSLVPAH